MPNLVLDLPSLPWPYFWTIDVSSSYFYVKVQRRTWWWPLRHGHIESTQQESIAHKGQLTQDSLNEASGRAHEMARQVDPRKSIKRQMHGVQFTNAKARIRKY